ncbi:hypothetical protein [Kiloniella sp. EL199]|uniref:hypothetical protein n=1 Tax=Kiloniella sp. EL199 TaxID=2107581 RepID=UPI0013C4065B|nr:hypothetical protein [Kiloniella sp. EL199]
MIALPNKMSFKLLDSAKLSKSANLSKSILVGTALRLSIGAFSVGIGASSYAQTQLIPQQPTSDQSITGQPLSETPATPGIESTPVSSGGIQVDSLGGLDLDSIGTLSPGQGGLGYDMWRQSSLQDVFALIKQMPVSYNSAIGNNLAKRMLLSSAGRPLDDKPLQSEQSLLSLRLEKLAELGAYSDLDNLFQRIPTRSDSEQQARYRSDSLLMTGKNGDACQVIQGKSATGKDSYWIRGMVYCHFLQKQVDQALLGLDLLRETGEEADPLFEELALAASGANIKLSGKSAGRVEPIHWALAALSSSQLPEELDNFLNPGVRDALVKAEEYSLERRVYAAEAAVKSGALAPDILVNLYSGYAFEPEEIDAVVGGEIKRDGSALRALFLQAAQLQAVPAARAEIVKAALDQAEVDGTAFLMSRVIADLVAEIPHSADLTWFALPAGRTLYLAGQRERADAWLLLARQYMLSEETAAANLTALWPYARLSGMEGGERYGTLKGWASAQSDVGPEVLNQQLVMLRSCMQALGENTRLSWGELASLEITSPGLAPSAALLYALKDAQNGGRLAEVVLLSLIILGEEGPGDTHSLALGGVVEALYSVGLQNEARSLAIEATVLSGI